MSETVGPKIISEMIGAPIESTLAVCPYCGGKLFATVSAWTQATDGYWDADGVDLDCESEPDIDAADWEFWLESHSDMPYVHMLPLCVKVTKWINQNYRFSL